MAGGVSLYFPGASPFASGVFESLAPRRARPDGKVVRAVQSVAAAVKNLRRFIVWFLVDMAFVPRDLVFYRNNSRLTHSLATAEPVLATGRVRPTGGQDKGGLGGRSVQRFTTAGARNDGRNNPQIQVQSAK